jgi:hypothetical protein
VVGIEELVKPKDGVVVDWLPETEVVTLDVDG